MSTKHKTLGNRVMKLFMLISFTVFLLAVTRNEVNIYAESASGLPESAVTIDYEKQEMKVVLGSNQTLSYGKGTMDKEPSFYEELSEDFIVLVTEDGNQKKVATIDLSYLSASKDEYLYIKGDENTDATKILVKKQLMLKVSFTGMLNDSTDSDSQWRTTYATVKDNVKIYGNFTAETGYLIFTVDQKSYTKLEHIEWRKGLSGQWKPFNELNLQKYSALGAQLYFRLNSGEEQISKESKLNLSKLSNAPNIVIDGAKHSIKLTNKMEYRVKVATGAYGEWTTPTFADNKANGIVSLRSLSGSDASSNGNGVTTTFLEMELQVRMKATDKKPISKTKTMILNQAGSPAFGSSGIEVTLVNSSDLTKGIKVTNHSSYAYQVAIVNKKVNDSTYGAYAALGTVKLDAKSTKEEGFLGFMNVASEKSVTIPYTKFKAFEKDYVVVCRLASIKDNTKTATNEFRLASPIVPVGGDQPVADTVSGAVMMDQEQTSIDKVIKFKVESPDSQIYVSIDSGAYSLNSSSEITVTGTLGSSKTIKAYSKNRVTEEVSETLTIILTFVSDGELSDYVNEWGYALCKKEDKENSSSNSRAIAYQRIYLAYVQFTTDNITVSDLNLSKEAIYNIVQRVRIDNPELLQATGQFSYAIEDGVSVKYLTLGMITKTLANNLMIECEEALTEIKAKIKELYGDTPTKIQQVKVVHDYLIRKKQYKTSTMDQTIAGALCANYTPVCMAYSMAFKYVCDELGVQTLVVLGYSGAVTNNHAWNILNLGDNITYATADTIDATKWYEMDVTWDDPIGAAVDYVGYDHFNITTSQMEAKEHVRRFDYYSSYPVNSCTGTTYSYANAKAQAYFSNGGTIIVSDNDTSKELLEHCGEVKPVMQLVE